MPGYHTMNSCTAYIDMEFAGIYGTRQRMQIPVEIGIVIHNPDRDTLAFTGRAFTSDVDVELWKNVMDDVGKRIDGRRRVFNLAHPARSRQFDPKFHLDGPGRTAARRSVIAVYHDLRSFMQVLNHEDIDTLVFFARRRELEALKTGRVNTEGFLIRDLQEELKTKYRLKEHVSLDRASIVTGFGIAKSIIRSVHFTYTIPERYRHVMRPHKAIGDAARIFLVDREIREYPSDFGERLTGHITLYEQRKQADSCGNERENRAFRPQTM